MSRPVCTRRIFVRSIDRSRDCFALSLVLPQFFVDFLLCKQRAGYNRRGRASRRLRPTSYKKLYRNHSIKGTLLHSLHVAHGDTSRDRFIETGEGGGTRASLTKQVEMFARSVVREHRTGNAEYTYRVREIPVLTVASLRNFCHNMRRRVTHKTDGFSRTAT